MFNEKSLARLSYRELQVLAAQHRVPGNIKKHTMIKVILAARRGDESEVTRVLNELQQTRKKRVKKIKKDVKTTIQSTASHNTNYQVNRYYAHQLKPSFHSAPNLQIVAKEEILNHDDDQQRISNYDNVHEYFIRAQRNYRYAINNNNDQRGGDSSSIIDLRINDQKSVIHQALPLDLHRATNILLSPTYNHVTNNTDNMNYHHFLDPNDSLETPLLLKKMLQAPAGTNLKEYAGPDGIFRVYSRNNYSQINCYDDSDTLTAESESNDNDDIDITNENLYCMLNADQNSLIHVDQNLIGNYNEQNFNSMNQNFTNVSDRFRVGYQLTDTQENCQKWVQQSSVTSVNNVTETEQDNAEIFKTIYHSNEDPLQNRINNMQANQSQGELFNDCSIITNNSRNINNNHHYNAGSNNEISNYYFNNDSRVQSSNSSTQQIVYNYENEDNNAAVLNNNICHNQQNNISDTSGYNSQLYNHDSEDFNNIYSNPDHTLSQPFNHNIGSFTGFNNQNEVNNARSINDEYYYSDIYSQSCQFGINVDHNEIPTLTNNQYQQSAKKEFQDIGFNQMTNNGEFESYFPRWKQSAITSVIHKNLENLLNIRKYNQLDETKTNETSSVFCYAPPIITPKQLVANANVCTQEKRFVVEKRKNSLLKINSNQVYNDAAQGRKMANVIEDTASNSANRLDMVSNNTSSSNDENFNHDQLNEIDSSTSLNDLWTMDRSNVSSDTQTQSNE
ncbi:hypothetical protein PV327_006187 [Microctonus hyperodae]|uniref:Uncharacterized protein n=1 Tax=Microctonus hyperodae TaxID=165561 RepID=A0AA39F3S7_MICHY|nr:hypothetical protein PV327_006187 [Microctonus hyperodae]